MTRGQLIQGLTLTLLTRITDEVSINVNYFTILQSTLLISLSTITKFKPFSQLWKCEKPGT